MIRKLKRIAPLQFGLVLGATYGLLSLILVPFFVLFAVFAQSLPHPNNSATQGLSIGVAIVMAIIFPIMYAILGFIGGILAAFIYNIVAKMVGGIEVEVE